MPKIFFYNVTVSYDRVVGRSENPAGTICTPLVEIGLTDLPKLGVPRSENPPMFEIELSDLPKLGVLLYPPPHWEFLS